jgi:Fe2+ transport system protein B
MKKEAREIFYKADLIISKGMGNYECLGDTPNLPIFFLFMYITFYATFNIGAYPMDWIDSLSGWLSDLVNSNIAPGPLQDLLANGIIGGVGSVIVFLPNILILYLFISFSPFFIHRHI